MLPALAFVAAIFLSAAAEAQPGADLRTLVVVNPANRVSSVTRAELSAIFMKRLRRWPDGAEIVPVDQPVRSRVRGRFSVSIHGKSVAYVTRYWQRLIFSGRAVPPREEKDDSAVIAFVSSHPDAIGYVDAASAPLAGVKVIEVTP